MNTMIDWSLYLVTDKELCLGRPLLDIVESAISGGVSVVQLREKNCTTREFVDIGKSLLKILRPKKIPLIINDRLDILLAIGADGLHIGQQDLHYHDARSLLDKNSEKKFLLGLSVENIEQVKEAKNYDLSYMALSPLYSTTTKKDAAPPWGLDGLKMVRQNTNCPLIAIGGINTQNASEIIKAGANGLAIVSALCSSPSPQKAAIEFIKTINAAKNEMAQDNKQ